MSLKSLKMGTEAPDSFDVVIEIPANADPVKYEIDKATGTLQVDRFIATQMRYPCNYGYIPGTHSEDGDPLDILVITPFPVIHGAVIRVRPVALLVMKDEAGPDMKILGVPVNKLTSLYSHIHGPEDFPEGVLSPILHFFEHYKALESGKWSEIEGWKGAEVAKQEILKAIEALK